jgi:methylmalonyl-CoA mutase
MTDLSLAASFPQATQEQWRALVDGVLKGGDFEKRLVSRSYDDLRIDPLYAKATDAQPVARAERAPWRVMQRIDHPDPKAANELALADLEGGADALALVLDGAPSARGFGVRLETADELERTLQGVMLDLIALTIETAPFEGRKATEAVAELVRRRGLDPASLAIDFGLDPLGDTARTGSAPLPFADLAQRASEITRQLREQGFRSPTLRVDTRAYHEAGASEAQELAAALATGVAYLRALEPAHGLEGARDALSFLLVADADEFLTVAKFRALRRLWAQVEAACGISPKPLRLHAETAWRMTTRRDPWVNLLRTTMATFSAGIGGADGITVLPLTAALGLPDAFARRVARNTQHILLDEANLWRVTDPAAGSGAFEALTDTLCDKAWSLFQELEAEGGLAESLARGAFQSRIAATRAARDTAIATRRDPITGTSEFPNIREEPVGVLMPFREASGSSPDKALPSLRSAEPFERLRDRADTYQARTGDRPRVFLANLGTAASFTARSTFAKNFYEAAGIEAISNDGFSSTDTLVEAYRQSETKLVCLCSSDEIYRDHAMSSIKALHESGASHIHLAGRPRDLEEELGRVGITTFIFVGCDTLRVLAEALEAVRA